MLLVAAVELASFAEFAVIVNQVPLLIERGLSTSVAAWALGLGGLGQVLGRLGYRRLAEATSVRVRSVLILGASAATIALLAAIPGPAVLLIAVAMLARGHTRGVHVAAGHRHQRPVGSTHYGRLGGLLTAPATFATALAPWAGAVLALALALGGYPAVFILLAALAALAAVLVIGSVPRTASPSLIRR